MMGKIEQIKHFCSRMGCTALEQEPMRDHTTFRIGGPAELFIRAENQVIASAVLHKAYELCVPVTIIGRGSNLLVSDDGIEGVVLMMEDEKSTPVMADETIIRCPAGVSLGKLCAFACAQSLTGLEFAWGIPASVGGAIYMNAGAYGGEIRDSLVAVEYLDSRGVRHEMETSQMEFGYRKSWFMSHPGCLITEALFQLKKGDKPTIRRIMEEHMEARKEKQPLEYPSAGSTFKRPPGAYASQLIDQCGLKGRQIGGAMVSKKHAGFLINYEDATCQDVRLLIQEVQREVERQTGFFLKCEVRMVGKMPAIE